MIGRDTVTSLFGVGTCSKKKTVSPESTPRQPLIGALGQICIIMRDGKVIYAGGVGVNR